MAKQRNNISPVDFVILQFLYAFQIIYESVTSILEWNFWQKPLTPATQPNSPTIEKRHFIQLYKTEPTEKWKKPICYMNVIEFDSSHQEEEIRKRRRSYDFQRNQFFLKDPMYRTRQRTHSDNDLQRFYCSNLRY